MPMSNGMDDGGMDVGDHDSGMGIFSIRGVTAFFTGFGWTEDVQGFAVCSSVPRVTGALRRFSERYLGFDALVGNAVPPSSPGR